MQSENIMKHDNLSERFITYGINTVRLCVSLQRSAVEKHLGNQLVRSGTSTGANYEEACGAQSRADFIHKLHLVLKDLRESNYWLKIIEGSRPKKIENIEKIINETEEFSKIIGQSLITAKKNKKG